MSQGRSQTTIRRVDVRFALLVAGLVTAALVVFAGPARSATQNIEVGNFYYGSQATTVINATVGDQLRFSVVTGTNHTVDIAGLDISSGQFNKDDPPFVVTLDQEGSFTIVCAIHQSQGHSVSLEVAPPPPTTTTTAPPTTTTTSTTTTTTTAPPGGTTTTTSPPGGTTTTTTSPPGVTTTTSPGGGTTTTIGSGATSTLPTDVSTTLGGGGVSTTTTDGGSTGPDVPGGTGDTSETGDQALGITSPAIDDAGWVRPLWWTVLGASIVGLAWVAIAWRRRPTEYD